MSIEFPSLSRLMPALATAIVLAAGLIPASSGAASANPVAGKAWPAQISARYRISFNGFDIGRFTYDSNVSDPRGGYRLSGNAEISALLGAFKWQGVSQSAGAVAVDEPTPQAYSFDYNSSAKSGSVRMGFKSGNVASVAAEPVTPPDDDTVPLERRHLVDVLDPLTAVMSLTRARAGEPCNRRLPIFDGKQRFDLVFNPAGTRRIGGGRGGAGEMAHVCVVRYQPLAGYKRSSDAEANAARMVIEMTLRPVPSANLLVPHEVTIPAVVGKVVLSLERIDIRSPGSDVIALVN